MTSKMVSVSELCVILAGDGHEPLSRAAISGFVEDGMPKAARGRYDVMACVGWYLGRLRNSVKRKERENADGKTTNLEDERRRLIAAQADLAEMEAEKQRGELIPLELYESKLTSLVITTQTRLLSIPGRLSAKLEMVTRAEAKALLTASIRDALSALGRRPHL